MEKLLLSESHEHMHNFHSCIHSHHYQGSTESNQTRCLWLWTQLVPFTVCWLWLPRWECPHLSGWLWFSFPFTAWFPQPTLNFTLLHVPLLIPLFNPNSFKSIESSKLFQPDQLPQEEKTNVLFLGSRTQFSVYNFFSPVVRLCWILLGVLILWSSTDPYLFHGCRGQGLWVSGMVWAQLLFPLELEGPGITGEKISPRARCETEAELGHRSSNVVYENRPGFR